MEMQTRIFLVDDHKLLRDTLRMFLESRENIMVVGEAGSGAEAIEGILRVQPDVVLMDISLPDLNGVEATAQLIKALPKTKVIAVTMHPEQLYLLQFLQAGGLGYIHKSAADRDLLKAIEEVQLDKVFVSAEGVQVIAGQYKIERSFSGREQPGEIAPDVLSAREQQVLILYAHGYSSREIGERLFLSGNTVDTYKRRISEKLQLKSRTDLVEYTIRHKIFDKM